MSVATRTDTQPPALRVADGHDLIRVRGARCPTLFTQVPRRRVLRSSPVMRSRKFGGGRALVLGVSWFNHVVMAMDRPR